MSEAKEGQQLKMKFQMLGVEDNRSSVFENFSGWANTKKAPLPIQKCGTRTKPWVPWGIDNCYPLFLNTLKSESPSQTGILNGKSYYLTAGGYKIVLDNPSDPQQLLLVQEFESNGPSQFTASEVLLGNVEDGEEFNGYAIRGVWNEAGTRPKFIEHVDFDDIRVDEKGVHYWFSNDWSQNNQSPLKTGWREIPMLNFNKRVGEFIVYVSKRGKKTMKNTLNVYPIPPYQGCIHALMTEIEHEAFDFYEIVNGFKTGTILNVPNPIADSADERKELAKEIKKGSTDRDATGGILVMFTEGGGTAGPTVLQLNGNNLPDRYINVSKKTANTIIRGHSIVTPALFGIATEGQLGQQAELEIGFEIFKKTYVQSRQKWYADTYTWILRNVYGIQGDFVMLPPPPLFPQQQQQQSQVVIHNHGQVPVKDKHEAHDCEAHNDEFLARDPVLKHFEKVGRKRSGFVMAKSSAVPVECSNEWLDASEKELMDSAKENKLFFATLLNERQKNVLYLLGQGSDVISIANELDITIQEVLDTYTTLAGKGLVKTNNELTEKGKQYIDATEIPLDKYEVRYSYELRPDAPSLRGESRSFCKELVKMDKMYTRAEIDSITAAIGRDVWRYRGGWYHNPTSDQNTPYCRHYWVQHLVVKN